MRIAHIVDAMEVGGKEMFVASLCRQQRGMGHEVAIYCLDSLGPVGETVKGEGFRVEVLGSDTRPKMIGKLAGLLAGCDVAHCHNVRAAVTGAAAARRAQVGSVINTRHNLAAPPYRWRSELQYVAAMRRVFRYTVAVCEAAAANLRRLPLAPAARIVAIHNGAARPETEFRETPRPVNEGFTLVQVSRLAEPKDPATMLRAFRRAAAEVADLRLWIVGDGALRPAVAAMVEELGLGGRVTLFGQRRDVGGFLAAADCFVLSSKSEGVPMAQLEAMSLGLPMIVTAVGGMPEVLPPGDGFVAVPAADEQALAKAMVAIAAGRSGREQWARTAQRHYEERFTLRRMAEHYQRLYEDKY